MKKLALYMKISEILHLFQIVQDKQSLMIRYTDEGGN